jgi:hypothetical protein
LTDHLGLAGHSTALNDEDWAAGRAKSNSGIAVAGTDGPLELAENTDSDSGSDDEDEGFLSARSSALLPRSGSGKITLVSLSQQLSGQTIGTLRAPSTSFSVQANKSFELAVLGPLFEPEIDVCSTKVVETEPEAVEKAPVVAYQPSYSVLPTPLKANTKKYSRLPQELIIPIISRLVRAGDILAAGKIGRDWWAVAKVSSSFESRVEAHN